MEVVRAGVEIDLRSPDQRPGTLAIVGRLFVVLADGRCLRAAEPSFGASFGGFFGERRVSRREIEQKYRSLPLIPTPKGPRHLPWRHLRDVLAQEGLTPSDEELGAAPFEVELSDQLLQQLDP